MSGRRRRRRTGPVLSRPAADRTVLLRLPPVVLPRVPNIARPLSAIRPPSPLDVARPHDLPGRRQNATACSHRYCVHPYRARHRNRTRTAEGVSILATFQIPSVALVHGESGERTRSHRLGDVFFRGRHRRFRLRGQRRRRRRGKNFRTFQSGTVGCLLCQSLRVDVAGANGGVHFAR